MFTVTAQPTFIENVTVRTASGDDWIVQTLRTRFRVLPQSEIEALQDSGGLLAVAQRLVVEFFDLADDAGTTLDGTGEWRTKLLDYQSVQLALLNGYRMAVVRHALGNSASSVGAGPPVH